MNENDRNLVRFLWVDDIHKENPSIVEYRFTRLAFGLTCSLFLINATVRHHLTKYIDLEEIKHVIEFLIYTSKIRQLHLTSYPTLSSFTALLNRL